MNRRDFYMHWYWYPEDNMVHLSRVARSGNNREMTGCGKEYEFSSSGGLLRDRKCPDCEKLVLVLELGE